MEIQKVQRVSGNQVELEQKLDYDHKSERRIFGSQQIGLNSEAISADRNVKFIQEGDKDSFIVKVSGSCLKKLKVEVENAAFVNLGNDQEPGLHFEQVGDCPDVKLVNNVFKNSKNTMLTLENGNYMNISNNTFLNGSSYGIQLKDAIEQHNVFKSNIFLNITSKDNPHNAAFYITHPNNIIQDNKVIGNNQGIGYFFDIKENPVGKSQRSDICPIGSDLGVFQNNMAQNLETGLEIKEYYPRKFPCKNMTSENEDHQATFENVLLFNIKEGFNGMKLGHLQFKNFTIGNSQQRNVHIQDGNYSTKGIDFENLKLFGKTINQEKQFKGQVGISLPQSSGLKVREVYFDGFGEDSHLFQTGFCHQQQQCKNKNIYYKGGFSHEISKAIITGSDKAQFCKWDKIQLDYIKEDGSLSKQTSQQVIIREQPHLNPVKECKKPSNQFDNSLVCQSTVQFEEIQFSQIEPQNIWENHDLYVYNLESKQDYSKAKPDQFTHLHGKRKELSQKYADNYIGIFAAGYGYHLFFDSKKDFTKLQINSMDKQLPKSIMFRFNHTEQRELFEVSASGSKIPISNSLNSIIQKDKIVNSADSNWINDSKAKLFYFNFGTDSAQDDILINGIYCQKYCSDNSCGGRTPITRKWSDENFWKTQALRKRPNESQYKTGKPSKFDTLYIPCYINLLIDVDQVEVYSMIIDGTVKFDHHYTPKDEKEIQLKSNFIWIRLGSLQAGTISKPFLNKVNIILTGKEASDNFKQDKLDVGNKLLLVNGLLELHGNDPEIKTTRLLEPAKPNDTFIKVQSSIGYNVGDEIIIASSSFDKNETERFIITSIEELKGRKININGKIKYYHYGHNDMMKSMQDDYVDMRSTVSLLNRNIKITGEVYKNEGYGGKILLNKRKIINPDTNQVISNKAGNILLSNIQISYLGQKNKYAGIQINNLDGIHDKVEIKHSTIFDCLGICLESINSERVKLKENVFYKGDHRLARIIDSASYDVQQNYFIDVNKSDNFQGETIALEVLQLKKKYDASVDKLVVMENTIIGSPEIGMYIPSVKCSQFTNIHDNTVSVAKLGVKFQENDTLQCQMFGNVNVFHCQVGLKIDQQTDIGILQVSLVKLYENQINLDLSNIKLNNGSDLLQNKILLSKSHIGQLMLKDCATCYSSQELCSDNIGIALPKFYNKNQMAYNQSFLIDQVNFYNFAQKYDQYICKDNYAFFTDKVFGGQGGVYMKKSKCNNCSQDGYLKIQESDPKKCGEKEFSCTGEQNILIQDLDGSFTEQSDETSLLTNEAMSKAYNCTALKPSKLFMCKGKSMGLLELKSLTVNNNTDKQFVGPVKVAILNEDGEKLENQVSHQQEINGKNLQAFYSLVEISKSHEVSFKQDNFPYRAIFSLESNQVKIDKEDYITIKLYLKRKLSVALIANGKDNIKTISNNQKINSIELAQQLQRCGSNMYDLDKMTVQFLLRSGCQVEIQLRNAVHFNLHLALENPDDFAKGDNQIEFIKSVSKFLKISDEKVKILKVNYQASRRMMIFERFLIKTKLTEVVVSFMIEGSDLSDNPDYSSIKDQQFLTNLANKLKTELKKDKSQIVTNSKKVIQVDFTTLVADKTGSVQENIQVDKERIEINIPDDKDNQNQPIQEEEDIPLIIIFIVILILMVIIIAIVIVYFYMKTKSKILQPVELTNNLDQTQQDLAKNTTNYNINEMNGNDIMNKSPYDGHSDDHSEDIDSQEKQSETKIGVNKSINIQGVNLNFDQGEKKVSVQTNLDQQKDTMIS